MNWAKHHAAALAIVGAFLVLGTIYSVINPVFEAPDEPWHYLYVKHVADGEGLPVQGRPTTYAYQQEGSQPPFYYLVAALETFWIDTGSPQDIYILNPHGQMGNPTTPHDKNFAIHTPKEHFPYHGVYLAVHIIRLLGVLIGAGTVALTYVLAREVAPQRRSIAAGAAALVAFNPMFIFISASVNNDTVAIFISILTLLMLVRMLKKEPKGQDFLLLGVVLAAGAITKLNALILYPLTLVALAFLAYRRPSFIFLLRSGLCMVVPGLVLAGWWYARNWLLYGEPTGLSGMLEIVGARYYSLRQVLQEGQGIFFSYWGVFGWFNVLMSDPIYRILTGIVALSCLGLLFLALRWRQGVHMPGLALLSGCFLFNLFGLLFWTRHTPGSQGRLLFPSLGATSTLLFLGLSQWLPARMTKVLSGAVAMAGFALAVSVPFAFIAPAYPGPHFVSAAELDGIYNKTYFNFDGKIELLGYEITPKEILPGHNATVTLYWRSLAAMEEDYSVFVHIFQQDGEKIGQVDSYPAGGALPTSQWPAGAILKDRYEIPIDSEAEAPSAAYLVAGLYRLDSQERLPTYDAQGRAIYPRLGGFKLKPNRYPQYQVPIPVGIKIGDGMALLGYGLEKRTFRADEPLTLTLYWQCDAKLSEDYEVFVHIVKAKGQKPVAQGDSEPQDGLYPTSFWSVGEVIRDPRALTIDPTVPPGDYFLAVGMYDWTTGERLPIPGEADGMRILAQITILSGTS